MAQCVKRWSTDLADRVRFPLEAKYSQPYKEFHCPQPFIHSCHRPDMTEILLKRT